MAKPKTPKAKATPKPTKTPPAPAIAVPYETLRGLLGKAVDDVAVTTVLATAGKVRIDPDFVIAKEAGFDFSLKQPAGAKRNAKKLLSTLFLFPEGKDGHRGYGDLPAGFAFTSREALLAALPEPAVTWKIGAGKVPVSTPEVSHDTWMLEGVKVTASYRKGAIGHITVALPDEAMGGRDLAIHPLHFATRPADAPPDAELVGMALLVAWAADRFGLPARHANTPHGTQLVGRTITPRAFLIAACNRTVTTLDVDPRLGDFLYGYTHRLFLGDNQEARAGTSAAIAKLLDLHRDDERSYSDDFLGTFKAVTDSPFHIPDSWDAVDRIGAVLDARFADYQATGFREPPELAFYERATELRDARAITPTRVELAPPTVDDALSSDLVDLIDRPLTDKHVKAVLARAGMPVGKTIDQQANPALGVSYMGTKFEIAGKRQLGVDAVWFFPTRYRRYIRGIGAEVEFVGYPGVLPFGLPLGVTRAEVAGKLGAPSRTGDDYDQYTPSPDRVITCEFADDKLTVVRYGKPASY